MVIVLFLLFVVGISFIIFSTLSSSVNKTTSSKAEAPASGVLKEIGGKNQECAIGEGGPYCKVDTSLVCNAKLDFFIKGALNSDVSNETKCIDYSDIIMGKEGTLCRKAESGQKQCDSELTCADVFRAYDNEDKKIFSEVFTDYLISVYKNRGFKAGNNYGLWFDNDGKLGINTWLPNNIKDFIYFNDKKNNLLPEPRGICIPNSLTKVMSCGELGQVTCPNLKVPGGVCFGNTRRIYDVNDDKYKCVPKITIKSKTILRCDDLSTSCDNFCSKQSLKCVETCEVSTTFNNGDQEWPTTVRGGLIVRAPYDGSKFDFTWRSGSCDQETFPDMNIKLNHYGCNMGFETNCCCDKK